MNNARNNKKIILVSLALIALIAVFGLAYKFLMPQPQTGSKNITFEVVIDGTTDKSYSISTDEEFLRKALESTEGLEIVGSESQYGLFVTEINKRKADDSKQEWWQFFKGDTPLQTGIDSTVIADGDKFSAELTVGYPK